MTDSDFHVSLGDTPEDTWYAEISYQERPIADVFLKNGEYVFSFLGVLGKTPPEVPLDGLRAVINLAKKRLLEVD